MMTATMVAMSPELRIWQLQRSLATCSRWLVRLHCTPQLMVSDCSSEAAAREQASAAQGSGPFDFLRQFPQFNQLRQFVQQNPQHLSAVLTSLASSNPQIWQLISQNQEEFMRLLREPVPEGTPYACEC
jgi:hypothetical protein